MPLDSEMQNEDHSGMDAAVELEIKQKLSQLSDADRRSISAFLLRLRHSSDEGKQERSRLMSEMDAGAKTRLSDLKSN